MSIFFFFRDEVRIYSREILCLLEPLLARPDYTHSFLSHDDLLYVYETICFLVLNLPVSQEVSLDFKKKIYMKKI